MTERKQTHVIPRDLLEKYFGDDPRLISAFENQALAVMETVQVADGAVGATEALENATFVTLSTNASLNNEFLLTNGDGTKLALTATSVAIDVDDTVVRATGGAVSFSAPGNVALALPASGTLISDSEPATLLTPSIAGLGNYATEAAAAAGGVPVGGMYRDGTTLKIRVT